MIRRLRARRQADGEAGMTLVEILVALTIMGLAIAGITAGLGTASTASATHRRTVNADTVVRDYAEAIKHWVRAGHYRDCAGSGYYSATAVGFTPPDGYQVSQTQTTYQQLGSALNVILVLDTSESIAEVSGGPTQVKDAAKAFVNGLAGTGARAALVTFSTSASGRVAPTTDLAQITTAINSLSFSGWTNWADALVKAQDYFAAFPAGTKPLVVMVTDGDPNLPLLSAMSSAKSRADQIKTAGSKIFGVGVGALNESNLQQISGITPNTAGTRLFNPPAVPFNNADYTKASSLATLQAGLADVAASLSVDTFVTGTCPTPDQGAQTLKVTASTVDGRDTEALELVVRKP